MESSSSNSSCSTTSLIDYHTEVGGTFQYACNNLISWIYRKGIKREQIVSIQANEATSFNSDAVAVLVIIYKKDQDITMRPITKLYYHIFKNTVDWDKQ